MEHRGTIYVGSTNPAKIDAVKGALDEIIRLEKATNPEGGFQRTGIKVIGQAVPSGVGAQPRSDEETIQGALNRCRNLQRSYPGSICIGLEGGVQETSYGLFLTNWGALIDEQGSVYIAGGARLPLPDILADQIRSGAELGAVIDQYAQEQKVGQKSGAVGILTENVIDRSQLFREVVLLLFGQKKHYSSAKI